MPAPVVIELDRTAERVWALVSDFGGLQRWHPLLIDCAVQGEGVGATRRAMFATWWAVEELVMFSPTDRTLAYAVIDSSRPEIVGVRAVMKVESTAAGARLTWTSGLDDGHPAAPQVNADLAAYYPVRAGHLRDALARNL